MKKMLVVLFVLGIVSVFTAYSFASFSSVSKSTITAEINFATAGQVTLTVKLNSGTALNWGSVTPGITDWQAASNYLILESTITHATGGIQIFTDNKATDANPKYNGTGNPAGLVGYDTGLSTGSTALPMCWRIVDVSTNTLTIKQGATGYPDRLWSNELGNSFPCFLWMKDKQTTGFVNGEDYVTMKDSSLGAHYSEGDWGTMQSPDYVYIGAKFLSAVAPKNYKTNTLRIEAFTE